MCSTAIFSFFSHGLSTASGFAPVAVDIICNIARHLMRRRHCGAAQLCILAATNGFHSFLTSFPASWAAALTRLNCSGRGGSVCDPMVPHMH